MAARGETSATSPAQAGTRRRSIEWDRWFHRPGMAQVILLLSLVVTGLAWYAAWHYARDEARQRFERRTDDIQGRIDRRMATYEAMLRGGVALLAAQPGLTRAQWRDYVRTVQPELHYPGIQGFGISRLIAPGDLQAHEREIQAEGFPAYRVRPPGSREAYTAIVYLEPFDGRNLRAFGFDMMSEATRREAMTRARDTGEPAISGIVTLVQEDGKDVQQGFLMYLPVYRGGRVDPQQLWGWVYAPFRVKDLMAGILGSDHGNIAFRVHDGEAGEAAKAFYRSQDAGAAAAPGARGFIKQHALRMAGRTWTVVYEGQDLEGTGDTWQTHLVAMLGLTIDLMLYATIASLARRKGEVEREVEERTAQLRSRGAWLDAVAGLSPDAVLVFERGADGQYRLVLANPAFSRCFGLPPEDLVGLGEDAVDEWLQGLAGGREPMPPLRSGAARIVLAGPPRRVLDRGLGEGERLRVHYFRDVTHESEVEALKTEFLGTAAHELRTPLASVYGYAELLQDERLDGPRSRRAVSVIYRQAGVLKHLVDELLDLARIDSRRGRDFNLELGDLRRIAEAAAESVNRAGEVSRVHLALPAEAVCVHADPAKLQQALVNVLSNALKYSQPPAAVSLSITTSRRDGRHEAIVRVVDAGMGMSADQCARAFERFYRADPSGQILGAGLGLSIVKEIVELHQGRVAIHSTPGAGTQVTVVLPRVVDPGLVGAVDCADEPGDAAGGATGVAVAVAPAAGSAPA